MLLPGALLAGGNSSSSFKCNTKYPVLLLHGIFLRDQTLGYDYFGRIPETLRDEGTTVFHGNTQAWYSHESNAKMIRAKILEITEGLGHGKVNIIAHSKGALETRVMLASYPELKNKVASFTSMAGPHRGSVLADLIFGIIPSWAHEFVTDIVNVFGLIQGDADPDSLSAGLSLTRANMAELNQILGDLNSGFSGIYCQSWASKIKGLIPDIALQATSLVMTMAGESPNDGAVAVSSAKYARFRGVISGAWWCGGVSHFASVDRGIMLIAGHTPGFDARDFYIDMVKELKDMGY